METSLPLLQEKAHQIAKEHGFWNASSEIPPKLMLIVCEVAEAMEEYRDSKIEIYYNEDKPGKPEGLVVELADAAIRIFDLIEYLGYDLASIIDEKMRYNETRPAMHGKVI